MDIPQPLSRIPLSGLIDVSHGADGYPSAALPLEGRFVGTAVAALVQAKNGYLSALG